MLMCVSPWRILLNFLYNKRDKFFYLSMYYTLAITKKVGRIWATIRCSEYLIIMWTETQAKPLSGIVKYFVIAAKTSQILFASTQSSPRALQYLCALSIRSSTTSVSGWTNWFIPLQWSALVSTENANCIYDVPRLVMKRLQLDRQLGVQLNPVRFNLRSYQNILPFQTNTTLTQKLHSCFVSNWRGLC